MKEKIDIDIPVVYNQVSLRRKQRNLGDKLKASLSSGNTLDISSPSPVKVASLSKTQGLDPLWTPPNMNGFNEIDLKELERLHRPPQNANKSFH